MLLAQVGPEFDPCLFDVWPVLLRPCGNKGVEGMDALQYYLVSGVEVLNC